MNKLTDDAMKMADKIDQIQPNTSVAFMLRRLVSELLIQRKHYDEALGLGKGTTEKHADRTDDRATYSQSSAPPLDASHVKGKSGAGEA